MEATGAGGVAKEGAGKGATVAPKKAPGAARPGSANKNPGVENGSYFNFLNGDNFAVRGRVDVKDLYAADKKSYWAAEDKKQAESATPVTNNQAPSQTTSQTAQYQDSPVTIKAADLGPGAEKLFATNADGNINSRQNVQTKTIELQFADGTWHSADSQVTYARKMGSIDRAGFEAVKNDPKSLAELKAKGGDVDKDLQTNLELDVKLEGLQATLGLAQSKGTPEDITKFKSARTAVISRANGISTKLGQAMGKLMDKIKDERTALAALQQQINDVNTQKLAYEKEKAKYEGIEAWENAMTRQDQKRQQAFQGKMGFLSAGMQIVSLIA